MSDSYDDDGDDDFDLRPAHDLLKQAEKEVVETYGVTNLERLGEGAYGYVYKGQYEGMDVVVKISTFQNTKSILKQAPKIRKKLLQYLHQKNKHKPNVANRRLENEKQFFTEDHVFHSNTLPDIIYHIMDYLTGSDLQVYLENSNTKLSFVDFMKIFCSLLQAMQFFHESGLIFNDLKLENVLVDPKYKRVVLIDYIDSCTGCTQLYCKDTKHIVKTFTDRHTNIPSIAEDIWRIALTILDAIHLYTTRDMEEMPANNINSYVRPDKDYPTLKIESIIKKEINRFQKTFPTDINNGLKHSFYKMLGRMLHAIPAQRPLIKDILEKEPFNVCNQKDYTMHRILNIREKSKNAVRRLSKKIEKIQNKNCKGKTKKRKQK
jgi:serine/threonine protein kinase